VTVPISQISSPQATFITYARQDFIYNGINAIGDEKMKIVNLCSCGSCCPVVNLDDKRVEIGEEGNLCVLTLDEWETLKKKILNREM
jgi:hypothetical protein